MLILVPDAYDKEKQELLKLCVPKQSLGTSYEMWSRRPRLLFKGTAEGGCSTFFILGGAPHRAMSV